MRFRNSERATSSASRPYTRISTERIMYAVEQQKRITNQLESLQAQQQVQLARVGRSGTKIIGVFFLLTSAVMLGLCILFVFQPDLFLDVLSFSSGVIDIAMQLSRYLSTGLVFITGQSWLLSGVALVVVIMIGIWIRLMRAPQEV
ncbi:MAG TPA: hypothetical protein VGT44_22305 [Ktedonobacteraceae bacterium]|nr:hypothetical protein [Ktedonobacteraceae bacterium]